MGPSRGARILILTDHPLERHIFAYLLAEAGYEVQLADSETHALQLAATTRPSAMVLDLHMDGDASRRLKALCPSVPLVVAGHFTTEARAQHMGAAAYVPKKNYGGIVDAVRAVLRALDGPPIADGPYVPPLAEAELLRRAIDEARKRIRQRQAQAREPD